MIEKQVHIFYSGMVQGVGFRYKVRTIAEEFKVFGWVKNLADGRVELIAEGAEKKIEDFLTKIDMSFGDYIKNKQLSLSKAEGCYKTFLIVF